MKTFSVRTILRLLGPLLLLVFQATPSLALIEAVINSRTAQRMPSPSLNLLQRTHVIVMGAAPEFSLSAYSTARMKALKWLEIMPMDQVYIVGADHKGAADFLKKDRYQVQQDPSVRLNHVILIQKLKQFSQIASVEVYSHSNPPYGLTLDEGIEKDTRYYLSYAKFSQAQYASMKKNFTADAFAVFYGCNSAWKTAPILSLLWGIPVAGALQATEFQILGRDGKYYAGTDSNRAAYGQMSMNKQGFQNPQSCGLGCYRMRPENRNYRGEHWGAFQVGLPFYKFFCVNPRDWNQIQQSWAAAYKAQYKKDWIDDSLDVGDFANSNQENITADRCLKSMARFMMSEPSLTSLSRESDLLEYKLNVQDFLCPHDGNQQLTDQCMQQLYVAELSDREESSKDFNFMNSRSKNAQCDLKSCQVRIVCAKDGISDSVLGSYAKGGCQTVNLSPTLTTTMLDEYKNYIAGFQLLKNEARFVLSPKR
jgi:hypothetical protein